MLDRARRAAISSPRFAWSPTLRAGSQFARSPSPDQARKILPSVLSVSQWLVNKSAYRNLAPTVCGAKYIGVFPNFSKGNTDGYLFEGIMNPRLIPSAVFYLLSNKGFDPEVYSGSKIPVLSFWKRNLGGNFKKEPLSPDSLPIRDSKKKLVKLAVGGRFELGDVLVPEDPFAIQSLE